MHNVAWTITLMNRMRAAIETGSLAAIQAEILAVWG
jgi:queuine/archaeosine tRNA-ribosyltransferase